MSTIANIPYLKATFDKDGILLNPVVVPSGTTDLLVVSHGWRNSADEANDLYTKLVTHMAEQGLPENGAARTYALVGIFWPSKNFDGLMALEESGKSGNAASLGESASDPASCAKLKAHLESLEDFATDPASNDALQKAISLIGELDEKPSARRKFIEALRIIAGPAKTGDEEALDIFESRDPEEIFKSFNFGSAAVHPSLGGTADPTAAGPATIDTGASAGFFDKLKGAAAAATNSASYLSYYLMKNRAGTVGQNGVAPLVDKLAALPAVERIHLVGHSFGARVVTAAAFASKTNKIRSLCLLQAAFSHNSFSQLMKGFFRPVITSGRIHGPTIITHTRNDTAVGTTYALASRVARQLASAVGDADDKYGGLGSNGAQQMNAGEVITGKLLATGGTYQLKAGVIHNLLADQFIANHGDVTGKEVANAINQAMA